MAFGALDTKPLSGSAAFPAASTRDEVENINQFCHHQPNAVLHRRPQRPRIGVVGCGYWGSKHIRVLSSLSDIGGTVAIDPNPTTLKSVSETFPAVRCFSDVNAAFDAVDAVIIATPPVTHARIALDAIAAGKHVMIEKPMTTSVDDAHTIVEAAEMAGVTLMTGHTFEFNPAIRELAHRMGQGELGKIRHIHSARLNLGLYRDDVDVVWDLAPHDISIINFLLRKSPDRVSAWGTAHACKGVTDLAHIYLHFDTLQVTAHIHVSWLDPRKVRSMTVVGSRKMAISDDLADERLRLFDCGVEIAESHGQRGSGAPAENPQFVYRKGDIVSPALPDEEPLTAEDRHFIHCVKTAETPTSDGWSGLNVVSVLDAVDRALTTGNTVEVEGPLKSNRSSWTPSAAMYRLETA